jgi:hypothetical protein
MENKNVHFKKSFSGVCGDLVIFENDCYNFHKELYLYVVGGGDFCFSREFFSTI